ncbi:MAG: hypothetical protein ACK417_05415 [Bacteroidia bacterium]
MALLHLKMRAWMLYVLILGCSVQLFAQQNINPPCATQAVEIISNGDFVNGIQGFTTGLNLMDPASGCDVINWDAVGFGPVFNSICPSFPSIAAGAGKQWAIVDFNYAAFGTVLEQYVLLPFQREMTISLAYTTRLPNVTVPVQLYVNNFLVHTIPMNAVNTVRRDTISWMPPQSALGLVPITLKTGGSILYDFAITDFSVMYCNDGIWASTQDLSRLIQLYPNPASSVFTIETTAVGGFRLQNCAI